MAERVRALFLAVFASSGALTAWTHLCQVAGVSFGAFSVVAVVLGAAVAGAVLWRQGRAARASAPSDRGTAALLGAMACAGAALVLLWHRPDLDDVNYVPNVVYYLDHPDAAMGFDVHYLVGEHGRPATSILQSTALPFEYAAAAVAHLTGIPVLAVRYFVVAPLLGMLVPLAWFWALVRLGRGERDAALGALVLLCGILLLGETSRAWGNYAFGRIHQGKAALLSLVLPLFTGAALEYLRARRRSSWWLLCALAATAVGMTGSAVPVLGLLAGLLLGAHWLAALPARPSPAQAARYLASLAYLVGYAALILSHARQHLGAASALNVGWPTTFAGHAGVMFWHWPPASAVAPVLAVALVLGLGRGHARRFVGAWAALALLLVLNPVVAPLLIEHVTSSNIYWRLFYVLPFPLAGGLAALAVLDLLHRRGVPRGAAVTGIVVLCLALHAAPSSTSVFRHGARLGAPCYRLEERYLRDAEQVAAVAPGGPMLAPLRVAAYLPMVGSRHPQLTTRDSELRMWVQGLGESEAVAALRQDACDFAGGAGGTLADLEAALARYAPRTAVLAAEVAGRPPVRAALAARGYAEAAAAAGYAVWVRG